MKKFTIIILGLYLLTLIPPAVALPEISQVVTIHTAASGTGIGPTVAYDSASGTTVACWRGKLGGGSQHAAFYRKSTDHGITGTNSALITGSAVEQHVQCSAGSGGKIVAIYDPNGGCTFQGLHLTTVTRNFAAANQCLQGSTPVYVTDTAFGFFGMTSYYWWDGAVQTSGTYPAGTTCKSEVLFIGADGHALLHCTDGNLYSTTFTALTALVFTSIQTGISTTAYRPGLDQNGASFVSCHIVAPPSTVKRGTSSDFLTWNYEDVATPHDDTNCRSLATSPIRGTVSGDKYYYFTSGSYTNLDYYISTFSCQPGDTEYLDAYRAGTTVYIWHLDCDNTFPFPSMQLTIIGTDTPASGGIVITNPIEHAVQTFGNAWGLDRETAGWLFGLTLVTMIILKVRDANPIVTGIVGLIAVGLAVQLDLLPEWLILAICFLVAVFAAWTLFPDKEE